MKRNLLLLALLACCLFSADSQNSRSYIREKIREWGECRNVAITKYNGDLALYGNNGWAGQGIPSGLSQKLNQLNEDNEYIDDVQLTEGGNWIVLWGDNGFSWDWIPSSLESKVREFNDKSYVVTSVTFNDAGDWILISQEYFATSADWITNWLKDGMNSYGQLWAACVTSDAMVACYENGFKFYGNVPEDLKTELARTTIDVYRVKIAGSSWFYGDNKGRYNYKM